MFRKAFLFVSLFSILMQAHVVWGSALKAELYYQQGRYEEAETLYRGLLRRSPNEASLQYNLGNVYYKKGEIGKAIVFYKRSLLSVPRDKDVRHNIKLVSSKRIDQISSSGVGGVAVVAEVLRFFTLTEFLLIFLSLLTVTNFFVFLWVVSSRRDAFKALVIICLGLLFSFTAIFTIKIREAYSAKGVIVSKKVSVKSGPSSTLPTLFFLHDGVGFRIKKQSKSWSQVELENGFQGWVNEADFWKI